MKKLENMTIEELISVVGLNLVDRDIQIIFNRDATVIQEFQEIVANIKIRNASLGIINESQSNNFVIREALRKMRSKVNKYTLVLLSLYNSQKNLENESKLTKEERKDLETKVKNAMELIGNKNFTVVESIAEGDFIKLKIINSTRLMQCIKNGQNVVDMNNPNKRQAARLDEIKEKVGLENIVIGLITEDIMSSIEDLEIGRGIFSQISWNSLQRFSKAYPEIGLSEIIATGEVPDDIKKKLYEGPEMRASMVEAIEQNCRYIDFNRLLMLSWIRLINLLEKDVDNNLRSKAIEESGEERQEGKEGTVDGIRTIIENIKDTLDKGIEIKIEDTTYTAKDIELSLKKFREGRYVRGEEIAEARLRMLSGETSLMGEDDEVLSVMILNDGEFEILIRNSEENVIFLVSKGIIEENEIKSALYIRGECSQELFSLINKKGILRYEDMLELFEMGIISHDMLLSIQEQETHQRIIKDTGVKVRELYLSVLDEKNDKPKETMEKFSRYATLYKRLNIDGKTEEEIAESSFALISSFEEDLTDKVLQGLYQFGIIPLEAAADWGVNLTEMLSNNSIKPTDMKNLVGKKVISIDSIKDVLKNGELSYEEKLDLIYSTFDGETEEEVSAREELIDFLGIGESYKADGESKIQTPRGQGTGTRGKEFITDPHARWKLISLLDKDYSKKFLPRDKEVADGHRVFLLPNIEKILIERMHERKAGRRVSAYGSATYIMNTDKFFENMDTIIENGAINRTFLRELSENEEATKIIHSKHWGSAIKRYFEITQDNERYTKEDIAEIDVAIANIEKSRKER